MAATVQDLLNSVQDSTAASLRCAGGLWKLALSDPDATYEGLRQCIDYVVTVGQKSPHVERCIRFFSTFASKASPDNEVAAAFVEELLQHLASHLSAVDKVVRYRSCQLLQHLLAGLPDHLLLDESVAATLRQQLAERLQDRLVAVRAEAVRCICHLIDDSQEGQVVLEGVLELLETDKSKDVRTAVLQSLPLHVSTLPVLLECVQGDDTLVRKAVIQRLHGISIKLLSIKQRAEAIQHVLLDKEPAVAEAGAELLAHWLQQDCQGDPLKVLQLLDVETYTEAAALLVESLIKTDSIKSQTAGAAITAGRTCASKGVISYVETAISSCGGSNAGGLVGLCELNRLLEPHEALMWRCLCEWLRNDAISKGLAAAATGGARAAVQAAVAAERHEVLERALPESADQLLQVVMQHIAAGPAARFAATQLLMIAATCVEWVDAASRSMAAPFLQQLISLEPTAVVEQADADLSDADSDSDGDLATVPAGMQLAGNGGDGRFEAAVVQLVLAVHGAGAGFSVAVLDGIAQIAAAAGLLAEPGSAGKEPNVTVCTGDGSCVLQCLAYIRLLLQQLPCGRPVQDDGSSLSFEKLWEMLLVLALKQEQPVIRAKAVECIALYALASACNAGVLTSAVQVLGPLAVAGGCSTTRKAALQGLTDIAMLIGPAAVDAILVASGAAAPSTTDAASDADGECSAGHDAAAAVIRRGLLELLIGQAEVLLAEAQAPVSKPKRGSRGAVKSEEAYALSSSSAELLYAVGESLAKLLLHQRTWLRRYVHYVHQATAVDGGADGLSKPVQAASITAAGSVPFPPDSQQHQALLLVKALALLLQLQFHPAIGSAVQLRRCLAVFFEVFAAAAREYRLQLVAACLPAARQALHLNSKQNPAVLLVKSITELLQHQHTLEHHQQLAAGCTVLMVDGQAATFEALALQLLHEVKDVAALTLAQGIQPTKYKPYLSNLLKLVCEIPLQPSISDLEALQALGDLLSTTVTDTTVKKDINAVQQLVGRIAHDMGADKQQLQPDQLHGLIGKLEALSLQLPPLPDAIAAVSSNAVATPAARTARKSAAARTGGKGAVPAGRMPAARGAAARKRAAASSSDEDSDSSSSNDGDTSDDEASGTSSDAGAEGTAAAEELSEAAAVLAVSTSKVATADAKTASKSSAKQPLGPSSLINV